MALDNDHPRQWWLEEPKKKSPEPTQEDIVNAKQILVENYFPQDYLIDDVRVMGIGVNHSRRHEPALLRTLATKKAIGEIAGDLFLARGGQVAIHVEGHDTSTYPLSVSSDEEIIEYGFPKHVKVFGWEDPTLRKSALTMDDQLRQLEAEYAAHEKEKDYQNWYALHQQYRDVALFQRNAQLLSAMRNALERGTASNSRGDRDRGIDVFVFGEKHLSSDTSMVGKLNALGVPYRVLGMNLLPQPKTIYRRR